VRSRRRCSPSRYSRSWPQHRLPDLDANLGEQQEIFELAASLAARCGDAYRQATDWTRKLLNTAVFERLDAKGGRWRQRSESPG
jgi:hypothetical protein